MKTLIELFDERPLENVLGPEMFMPENIIYVCPPEIASDSREKKKLERYFSHRGMSPKVMMEGSKVFKSQDILDTLRRIAASYPDCAIDITGGTDAALFAAGRLCGEVDIPAFTYSRRKNAFFDIYGAPFKDEYPCNVKYNVEDFFVMAGGSMRKGRVDNKILDKYMEYFDSFFHVYLRFRKPWGDIVTYIQRVSKCDKDTVPSLHVSGDYIVKGERGNRITAPKEALRAFEQIGFIKNLTIEENSRVSFDFMDLQVRTWLRDIGSVLELYVYKACRDCGLFNDVITSAIVDWEGHNERDAVSNEIDVMATRGVIPVFISCKTCDVKTEALNELAVLRDRFGGQIARSAIVTAERGGTAMRNRAQELGISVIDLHDLSNGLIEKKIKSLMK